MMKEQEKVTMYIDFSHLTSFDHEDPDFIKQIVTKYNKYDKDLRNGLVKFLQKFGLKEEENGRKVFF